MTLVQSVMIGIEAANKQASDLGKPGPTLPQLQEAIGRNISSMIRSAANSPVLAQETGAMLRIAMEEGKDPEEALKLITAFWTHAALGINQSAFPTKYEP